LKKYESRELKQRRHSPTKKLLLFYHTVKYLRWSQLWFRLYYRMVKLVVHPPVNVSERQWVSSWLGQSRTSERSILSIDEVRFLGESGCLFEKEDWNSSHKSKLWLYHLHYLEELGSIHAPQHRELLNEFIEKWIRDNPPCLGVGWEPYPLSLRLVNLVKWYKGQTTSLSPIEYLSLSLQAEALYKQREFHIRGNHLFVNGKALVFIGAFFSGNKANFWVLKGLEILDEQMEEQFLKDGGHFELSPMYHALLLWDLCDLVHLADCSGLSELLARKKQWQGLIKKALQWLQYLCHPDGEIAFFNDAALGAAPRMAELECYASQLGIKPIKTVNSDCHHLIDSGFCVINLTPDGKAILDVGLIGPDEQPGHAHADSLSFELSLFNQRVIVNSGTSTYSHAVKRHAQRRTRAHNTVTINEQDSSEVWAEFRVGRRAKPFDLEIHDASDELRIACSHDGYLRLKGRPVHRRSWSFSENKMTIHDTLTGHYQSACARFYFHPTVTIQRTADGHFSCLLENSKVVWITIQMAKRVTLESSTWHPNFGKEEPNQCLVVDMQGPELLTDICWQGA